MHLDTDVCIFIDIVLISHHFILVCMRWDYDILSTDFETFVTMHKIKIRKIMWIIIL